MEATNLLRKFKIRFEPHLKEYFEKKNLQAAEIDSVAQEAVSAIEEYTLSGGKRVRPAVLYYAYLAAGGEDSDKIVRISMAMELLHSFLLIHDDIIDRDSSRHGTDTIHEKFKKIAEKYRLKKDSEHFGNSMAIIIGDMAAAMACDIIFNSDFPDRFIIRALNKLQEIVFLTIPGEMIDVIMSFSGEATEKQILKMYEGKTARYTFEGPLHMGCLLAGADKKMIGNFSGYALPLGKAFQIKDDILGIFGNEERIGKPVGSDIAEGKQTLLVIKALEKSSREQKKTLRKYLNKKDLKMGEIEEFRKVIRETGSLDYTEKMAKDLVEESQRALSKIEFKNDEAKIFLSGLADYVVKREV